MFGVKFHQSVLAGFDSGLFDYACRKLATIGTKDAAAALAETLASRETLSVEQKTLIVDSLIRIGQPASAPLIAQLKTDPHSAPELFHALCIIADPASEDYLIEHLSLKESADTIRALTLMKSAKAIPLLEKIARGNGEFKVPAIESLHAYSGNTGFFAELLTDTDLRVRMIAGSYFDRHGDAITGDLRLCIDAALLKMNSLIAAGDEALPLLRTLLSDNEISVRMEAVKALSEIATKNALNELSKALSDRSEDLRGFAAERYAQNELSDPFQIINLLSDEDASVRSAAEKIIITTPQRYLTALTHTMEVAISSGISLLELTSLQNLFVRIGDSSVSALKEMIAKGSTLAAAAAEIAADIASEETYALLETLTVHANPTVKTIALEALGERHDPTLFERIVPLLNDRNDAVRKSAYDSLVMTDIARAEEILKSLSANDSLNNDDRVYIRNILTEISRVN